MPKLTYTTPPPSLMAELREVATDAAALATELSRANRLPENFPAEQLHELLTQLQTLPEGTAEGCRQPLEYARARLPALRRQFIQTEEQSRQPRADDEKPPPLTRGMVIDQQLGVLVNSVTTAFDAYRELASVQDDDAADTAPSREIDPKAPDVAAAMASARGAEVKIDENLAIFAPMAQPGSANADNFQRQMRDARGLLSLARIEVRMPNFVPRWYRKTVDAISDYPKILDVTATAMERGTDIAEPLIDGWHHFKHGVFKSGLEAVRHTATGLRAVARRWEADRTKAVGDPGSPQSPLESRIAAATGTATGHKTAAAVSGGLNATIDPFTLDGAGTVGPPPDFSQQAAEEKILAGQPLPPSWRPHVTQLGFGPFTIDADGSLGLRTVKFESRIDLGLLSGLTHLRHLALVRMEVRDLAPLNDLAGLQTLWLTDTQVIDLAPLSGLAGLQLLVLDRTPVIDLGPLSGLAGLRELYLEGTQVRDLGPLSGLTRLQRLTLNGSQVIDLTPLSGLAGLQTLWLINTQVSAQAIRALKAANRQLTIHGTGRRTPTRPRARPQSPSSEEGRPKKP